MSGHQKVFVNTALRWPRSPQTCALYVDDILRAPLGGELRHRIRALLGRGERTIVLNLARVRKIDAAGVGELVRAYNMVVAAGGMLRIERASKWIREILDRVGLINVLSLDRRG